IRSTTATFSSPHADGSACITSGSTSQACWPVKGSASRKSTRGIWLASFMHDDLGYFDLEQKTLQPLDNPFGTRSSPMSYTNPHIESPTLAQSRRAMAMIFQG